MIMSQKNIKKHCSTTNEIGHFTKNLTIRNWHIL